MKSRILAAVFALAAAGSAQAVDYTLNVPVNVSNFSPGGHLSVECRFCEATGQCLGGLNSGPDVVAHSGKVVPLVNGAYSGTISIVFSGLTDQQVGRAVRYKCDLANGPAALPSTVIKPNSNSVISVEGKVQ